MIVEAPLLMCEDLVRYQVIRSGNNLKYFQDIQKVTW